MQTAYMSAVRVIAVVLAVAVVAAPAAVRAQSVSPSDYDVPVSTSQHARLGVKLNYSGEGSDVQSSDGSANLVAKRFYNSLPLAHDLSFNGIGSTRRVDDEQTNSYNFVAQAGIRKYFSLEDKFFYSMDVGVTGNDDYDRPAVEVTPGVGYGRFIQVTTLAQAVRIEEFLLEEGVITGHLPKGTMIELAQVIERQSEFASDYGARYQVKWFEAMEEVISRSGRFTDQGLGAAGSLRMQEVLFEERINPRFIGWDARAGVQFEALTPYEDVDRQDPSFSGRLRYSRPVGWVSQLDLNLQYTSPFTSDFGADAFTVTTTLNYLYEISNRIDFTASNILTTRRLDPDIEVAVQEEARAGLLFYLENHINLNLTGEVSKVRGQTVSQAANLALEYRLR